jgi:tetratricopeptide (TPR) repeat protein
MITARQKFFLILIGLIIIPLTIECSLRLAGLAYYLQRAKKETKEQGDENSIKILCLGDSFTFGSGAEPGYSYPEQLERLLNKNNPNSKFIVYNRGGCIPGLNSSQLLKILDKNIAKYQPQIIIVLIGMHNKWNLTDSNYFLFTPKGWRSYLYWLDGLLTRLRTYKLLKITIGNLKDRIFKKTNNVQIKNRVVNENLNLEVMSHLKLAETYLSHTGEVALAIEEYKRVIDLDPNNDEARAKLGRIYENQNKYEMAITEFKRALEINPNNLFARNRLWNVYFKQGKNRLAIEEIKQILKIDPQNEGLRQISRFGLPSLGDFEDKEIQDKLLRYDLEGIIKLAKAKGIKPILLSYPNNNDRDEIRRELADRYRIPFIDIFSVFSNLRSSNNHKEEDYFAKDGHCNAKGYAVMAEEIYKVLMAENAA